MWFNAISKQYVLRWLLCKVYTVVVESIDEAHQCIYRHSIAQSSATSYNWNYEKWLLEDKQQNLSLPYASLLIDKHAYTVTNCLYGCIQGIADSLPLS